MILRLPYPPSTNRYWRNFRGRTVLSAQARAYKADVRKLAHDAQPLTGRVSVWLEVGRPIKRGDLDNRIKVLLDALQGVAYLDDSQVFELYSRLVESPRDGYVIVGVSPLQGEWLCTSIPTN